MRKIFMLLLSIVMILSLVSCGADSSNHEGEAKTPSGSSIQKGRNYQEVLNNFEEKGFTNIQLVSVGDLITGWLTKDGEVESVSVDGDVEYSADTWYPNDVAVVITYHTFPEDESTESDGASNGSEAATVSASESEKMILTEESCKELASILALTAEIDPLYSDFAETYKGRLIEFDGCITYMENHDNYNTRYDILLSAGDYVDENTANPGPIFKFEDVNAMNLGIEDLFLPEFFKIGCNVRVVAEILEFNSDTGIFFLEPVSVKER